MANQLSKKIIFQGRIMAITGLMVGGSNSSMSIGLPDKVVIRNPVTNKPYIPGSSLKGKMRSLLEQATNAVVKMDRPMGKVNFGPNSDHNLITTQLFGNSKGDANQRPSRIIFRDGELLNGDDWDNTDMPYTEAKTEVVIDRVTSQAMPRTFERVPAGAEFSFGMVLNIVNGDQYSESDLLQLVYRGLQLIEDDYIGGSGSRGSGQVKFYLDSITERPAAFYFGSGGESQLEIPAAFKA